MKGKVIVKVCFSVVIAVTLLICLTNVSFATGNNTTGTATVLTDDQSYYSTISSKTDVDWYKIKFSITGMANFYLGSVPSNCDYDLSVYKSNGTTLLAKSQNVIGKSETIRCRVNANQYYFIKVESFSGSSTSDTYLIRSKVYTSSVGRIFGFEYTDPDMEPPDDYVNSVPCSNDILGYLWNMKYSGTVYKNNAASSAYGVMPTSEIFCVINHANAGRLTFYSETYNEKSYIYADYGSTNSISDYVTDSELSEIELAIYAGCYTGKTDTSSQKRGNLVEETLAAGAYNCIGFEDAVDKPKTHAWLRSFFLYCRDGFDGDYTIHSAILGALDDLYAADKDYGGMNLYYEGDSRVDTTVIGGNF